MTKKLFIKTWGCQMNVYDSKKMADVLTPLGYETTDTPRDADLMILNTCHIREKATEKVFSDLGRLRAFKEEKELMLKPGDRFQLGPYQVQLTRVGERSGANYSAVRGQLDVSLDGPPLFSLHPERRMYRNSRMPTTEAAIHDTWWRDVYLSLGNEAEGAWAVKAYLNPLVKWLWAGVVVMGLGTGLALLQGRRQKGTMQ